MAIVALACVFIGIAVSRPIIRALHALNII
jgi:hypothetical protein